ncbi:MAG: alpha/beta hydrolase [Phycisphaerae bacterium]|nr:alpha/beta hydrolase [Phycisphaerae bacterium]
MTSAAPKPPSRSWRRRLLCAVGCLTLAAFALRLAGGCYSVGPTASKDAIALLPRATIESRDGATTLSYLHAGNPADPRIIYIHGTPGDAENWADLLLNPVAGCESLSIDRPGFGKTQPPDPLTSFEAQAAAIAPLLLERRSIKPILVGHSLGGPIAARLAADHPDRVGGLLIVAGSFDPVHEELDWLERCVMSDTMRATLPRALANSLAEFRDAKRETLLLAEILDRITCPTIVIHGATDGLVPYENVSYIQRKLINARPLEVTKLPDQGHFIPWQCPDQIRTAIDRIRALLSPPATRTP